MTADSPPDCESWYRAAWIVPVDAPPIQDGVIGVQAGKIQAIRAANADDAAIDLDEWVGGKAIVLPGLINAHTHLEFDVAAPLGEPNRPITDWIPNVMAWRRDRDADSQSGEAAKTRAIQTNLQNSLRAGVTRLGEIATPACRPTDYRSAIDVTAFLELIALSDARNESARQSAFHHLQTKADEPAPFTAGLSPHAPYTVNLELLEDAVDLSERTGVRLQMHLAETREELELMGAGSGPFRRMLESVGVWDSANLPLGMRPLDYLERLAKSSGCVVAHGNYMAEDEIQFLAEHRSQLSVAYCPRTHAYFGHDAYPLTRMLEAGVNVALGTDSLASNPDLSLLNEVKFLAANSITSPETAVRLATAAGAEALGHSKVGAIRPGNAAELLVLRTSDCDGEPYDKLVADSTIAAATMIGGQLLRTNADA